MRILICGDRNYTNKKKIKDCLQQIIKEFKIDNSWEDHYVIHGCASGADSMGGIVGKELGFIILEFPAEWSKYGNGAGPIRNRQQLKEGKPDLVMAFHPNINTSKGTKDMVYISKQAGVPVRLFE